jgi:tRNA-modifying protein YgfZ
MHYVSPEHQIVTFEGADALVFLQSQLTNDVAALAVGQWQWQGYCNAKGRLHATFALARTSEQAYAAVVHSSVVPFLVKRLTMFRLRSKVAIAAEGNLVAVHHFEQPATSENTLATLDLGHGRWVTIERKNELQPDDTSPQSIGRWKKIGIESMQPEIVAETNEMFVPQMIGWDKVLPGGGVSFSKGCYPGQEIVARAHYRGAVKRELALMHASATSPLSAGQTIVREDNSEAQVVNCVTEPMGHSALVVVAISLSNSD